VNDGPVRSAQDGDARIGRGASIDELLDRAVAAINRGDRATATALAGEVLAEDEGNADAEDLLTAPGDAGEIRRLTILFADLVDSTALSTQVEPETYRMLVGRYREQVLAIVNRYEGHVGSTKGDGLLVVFGHPRAHEDDVRRAVVAGLEITREVAKLSEQAQRRFRVQITVRVGVHRGLVYLDTAQDDVYGLAANLAARVSGLAPPGSVVVSDAVEPLVRNNFELEARAPAAVKGVQGLLAHFRVIGEQAAPARVERGPLVGRDRELARLHKSWARAHAGTLTTPGVVFRGEPGIGKSRLAAAAIEQVTGSDGVVLELAGSPFHTDVGLHPVRTLIERRCGFGRLTDPAERLRRLDADVRGCCPGPTTTIPLLAPVLGIGPEHGYQPVAAEGRKLYELIAEAVGSYLLARVGDRAGLLVAEDVHWFDPSTREVLGSMLKASQGRLLVIITGRDGAWLPAEWPVKVFDLAPLTDEQTDELVMALDPTLTAEDRAAVRDRCDGVPFYVEQVVAGLEAVRADGARVPEALYEPLFARLRASPDVVPVVEAAAVIGRNVDRGLLLAVLGLDENQVDDAIDELEDALVLEPYGPDGWRFRHELLREVAAELAPPSVRRGLHAKVADALVGGAGGDPDWRLVAGHYEQAERFDQAAAGYQQASAEALRRGALAEARTYLNRAISHLDRVTPGSERDRREIRLRLERGMLTAAAEGAGSQSAAADMERCLQLGGTDPSDDQLFAALGTLSVYYVTRGDLRRADQIFELLRSSIEQTRPWARPVINGGSGVVAFLRGEVDAARRLIEEWKTAGATAYEQVDEAMASPFDQYGAPRVPLALVHVVQGNLSGADAQLAQAAEHTEQVAFPKGPHSLAYTRFAQVWMCTESGQLDRAAVLAADMLGLAERHGFDLWRLIGTTQQAAVSALASLDSDWADGPDLSARLGVVSQSLDTWRAAGFIAFRPMYDGVLGRLLVAAGQPDEARGRLDVALQLAEETGLHYYDAELLRLRTHTNTDRDARLADLTASVALARRQGAHLFGLRAALDDFELRGQPARAALVEAIDRMPTDSGWPELARAQVSLSEHSPRI
jgi:class 3 adenylate cyclase/tetratricopeptide (TPR) repeat protein